MELLFPLVVLGLMWVLLVRPQQQRVRRQRELVASLEVGDEVVTAGGAVGRIVGLDADEVRLEVAPGVTMRFLRLSVNARVDEGAEEGSEEPEARDEGEE
ncbi:MAG: preprotein translocase subunit YajC [Actinomycetota bacterium]|nr:preprotein translocase subunit YajC [Actinomycetota bacterium]